MIDLLWYNAAIISKEVFLWKTIRDTGTCFAFAARSMFANAAAAKQSALATRGLSTGFTRMESCVWSGFAWGSVKGNETDTSESKRYER